MPRHTVEISDESGNSFKVLINVSMNIGLSLGTGTWRTLDKGAIKFNSGPARFQATTYLDDDFTLLLLATSQSPGWGLRLNDYAGSITTNDDGMGLLAQAWCLSAKPGRISWVLAD